MIVCLCAGTNDRKVKQVIDEGARSVDDVGKACGAGTRCGGCRDMIGHLIAERTAAPAALDAPAAQPA